LLCCFNKPPRLIACFTSRRVQLANWAARYTFSLSAHHPIGIWVERIGFARQIELRYGEQRAREFAQIDWPA
jgi:hypothetical protein